MELDAFCELFEIRVRGVLAAAFAMSGKTPSATDWDLLNGISEISLRDIGEISHRTGFKIELALTEISDGEEE